MRYGFCIPHHRPLATPRLIAEAARRGEDLGFDTIWLSDHVMTPNVPEQRHRRIFYEPLAVAAYLAAATSRVRIGTSVLVVPYRHPVVTAKQISTIDALSGGRLVLGVGVGALEGEFNALGVSFPERGPLTDEYLAVMRELWTNDDPRFDGRTVHFENVTFWPKPAQRPAPPILVAGNSARAIRRAAAIGDGWHPTSISRVGLEAGIQRFRAECERLGRPTTLPIVYRSDLRILAAPETPRRHFTGTPDQILEDLRAFAEAGVDEFNFDFAVAPVDSAESWLVALDRFANEIRPPGPK